MIRPLLLTGVLATAVSCVEIQAERTELVFGGPTSRTIASNEVYPVSMQVAPRGYIVNVLREVFSIQENSSLDNKLINEIYKKVEFGGGCDVYEASETAFNVIEYPNEACGSIATDQVATSNPMRFSITSKACEDILADSATLTKVRNKIFASSSWGSPSDYQAIEKMWKLFYPIDPINDAITKSLEDVGYATSNNTDAWKTMIFTVCSSPGWQVL